MPGGSAAGSALGYRLLTLSGIRGPDAGFALATAGLGSAVVLNLIFWTALLVSIPLRGVNPLYVTAALLGLGIMLIVALLVVGLQHGQGRAEAFLQLARPQAALRPVTGRRRRCARSATAWRSSPRTGRCSSGSSSGPA